jgi:serine protease Do
MSFPFEPVSRRTSPIGRVRIVALAAGLGLCLAAAPLVQAQTAIATPPMATQLPSLSPLVKKVMPAVVNISVTMKANAPGEGVQGGSGGPNFPPSPFDQFLRRFFEQQQQQQQEQERGQQGQQDQNDQDNQDQGQGQGQGQNQGDNDQLQTPRQHLERMALGSGFIIDPTGYVVTNNHVVQNADKVTVVFQDDSKHPAKVIGRDAKTDLALLKIETDHPLPYVSWGDSGTMQVGDWVVAVGNPFGLGGTVSSGIISARGRDIHEGPYDDFLQIDASINRGNSGGPTFNLNGQVIGINTAIYSPNGGSVGIGFAIPSDLAKPVIEQLREHGKVERGWLGVQIQQVTPEIAKSLGLPKDAGALVADVTRDGPAAKAGFKQGDVILSYDGHDISKVRDLPIAVAETPVGKTAEVKIWRKDHDMTLDAVVGEMPDNPQVAMNGDNGSGEADVASSFGLKFAPLTENWHRRLHVPANVKGVVVTGIADNSPLADLDIAPGDVIETVNQQPVTSPKEASDKLAAIRNDKSANKTVLLLINRHGVNQYVALPVQG